MSTDKAVAHTPGPWQYAPILCRSENDRGWLVCVPDVRIADVWPMNDEDGNASPEAKANARLIAAAPDLLATLRKLIEAVDEHLADNGGNDPYKTFGRRMRTARAAIAKATGEADDDPVLIATRDRGYAAIRKAEGR